MSFLAAPEILYGRWCIDTSTTLWWGLWAALLVYGAFGRLIDQRIRASSARRPLLIFLAAVLFVAVWTFPDWNPLQRSNDAIGAVSQPVDQVVAENGKGDSLDRAIPFIGRWEAYPKSY